MVAFIGPPPMDFVRRSETTEQCFDRDGKRIRLRFPSFPCNLGFCVDTLTGSWIAHKEAPVPPTSLESLETRLSGPEKESFLHFLRSMLKWLPEERKTARQLLDDPWLL